MPAGLIRVTPEELESASSQLNAGAGQIDSLLKRLSVLVGNLGQEWAGTGHMQFHAAYTQWQSAQVQLHQALETISRLTANAAVSYRSNDQTIGSSFNSV